MVKVGRAVNGISINGLEYLLDDKNEIRWFESEIIAREFLKDFGLSDEELDSYEYIEGEINES